MRVRDSRCLGVVWVMTGGNRPELMSDPQPKATHPVTKQRWTAADSKTHTKLDTNQGNEETTRKKLTNCSCIQT